MFVTRMTRTFFFADIEKGGFPTVVGPEAVTPNNTAGGIHFDSTVDVFDPLVVSEYLSGTGNAGGPLVTSFNESSRSDLRLYESDNNATMVSLKAQGQGFQSVCKEMMRRMVETVPKGVVLGDTVQVLAVKPINATLDFDATGGVVFKGAIRVSPFLFFFINPSSIFKAHRILRSSHQLPVPHQNSSHSSPQHPPTRFV